MPVQDPQGLSACRHFLSPSGSLVEDDDDEELEDESSGMAVSWGADAGAASGSAASTLGRC